MTKSNLIEKVRRRLGYPLVKVELDDSQVSDHIDYARSKYIKWAVGNATHECYFTMMLSAGQFLYDMPSGVTEVIGYSTETTGGINTLFTIENYLYNQGMFESFFHLGGFSMLSYHITMDFLETLKKYVVDAYNFKYHPYTNQLEIQPPPPSGGSLTVVSNGVSTVYDSPGWILIRAYMVEGSTVSSDWSATSFHQGLYDNDWMLDYVTALSKVTLGRIRSKFANFASIGNAGISLDGSDLISEGKEEIERLEEKLRLEESYESYDISMA